MQLECKLRVCHRDHAQSERKFAPSELQAARRGSSSAPFAAWPPRVTCPDDCALIGQINRKKYVNCIGQGCMPSVSCPACRVARAMRRRTRGHARDARARRARGYWWAGKTRVGDSIAEIQVCDAQTSHPFGLRITPGPGGR